MSSAWLRVGGVLTLGKASAMTQTVSRMRRTRPRMKDVMFMVSLSNKHTVHGKARTSSSCSFSSTLCKAQI